MKKVVSGFIILLSFGPVNAQPAQTSFCGKKLIGYIPYWSTGSTIDYSNLTHAFFSFLKPQADGSIAENTSQKTALNTFLLQTQKYSCKKFISLSDGGAETFPVMAANPAARQKFIKKVIAFCKEKGFEGIDLDWESMNNEARRKNYTVLLKEFRQAIGFEKLELVATVYYGERCQWIENEALQQADWIQVMVYDQTGLWNNGPFGNHASFEHFLQAEKYWTDRGFQKQKMVMGLPFYGYRFSSEAGGKGKAIRYKDIAAAFPDMSPAENQTPGKDWCFFNGPELIQQKTRYVLENGFAGIMIWEMSQDSPTKRSLHKAILEIYSVYCNNRK